MRWYKYWLYIILLLSVAIDLSGMEPSLQKVGDTTQPKKKFYLTFNIDIGVQQLYFNKKDIYEGEYLQQNFFRNTQEWIWRRDEDLEKGTSHYKMRSYQLTTLLTPWKRLNVGLDYHLMLLLDEDGASLAEGAIPNFSIAVIAGYEFRFPKTKGFFLHPSVSLGSYQSNDSYQGPGKELHASFKLATGYIFKGKWLIRAFIADNLYRYKEESVSSRFDMEQIERIKVDVIELGLGVGYRFAITPD